MTNQIVFYNDSASAWEKALYAFLGEKQRRSGSKVGEYHKFPGMNSRPGHCDDHLDVNSARRNRRLGEHCFRQRGGHQPHNARDGKGIQGSIPRYQV